MSAASTLTPSLVTSWLPVTTAYSAPAVCSSLVWEGYPPWLAVNDPQYGYYVDKSLSCLPRAATSWWNQNIVTDNFTTYLIGPIACPRAYTTATTSVTDSSTFVACCPSKYSLSRVRSNNQLGQCVSDISAGQTISLVTFTTITNAEAVVSAWATVISTVTSRSFINGIQMNGWNFRAAPQTQSESSPPSTTTANPTEAQPQPTSTPPSTNLPPTNRSGLSSKTKIGLGIGVSLGVIALVAAILAAFWYGRRGRAAPPYKVGDPHDPGAGYYAPGSKPGVPVQPQEMASGLPAAHEVEGGGYVGELYGTEPARR